MRNIFTVNATQVNAQGVYSKLSGFPKDFDSESYLDPQITDVTERQKKAVEIALRRAKSAFYAQCSTNYGSEGKIMQTVTLVHANGQMIMRDSDGGFPADDPLQ